MALNPIPWLKIKDNREAALAVVTITTALLTGGWFLYGQLTKSDTPAQQPPSLTVEGANTGIIQQGSGNEASQ